MRRRNTLLSGSGGTMAFVRQQIERGGERLWRLEDFRDRPFAAVAQALSRLTRQGRLERLSKGVYYRTRDGSFGKSRPNPAAIQRLASRRKSVFPSGIAAANLLGFSTQTAKQNEVATSALSLPRKLVGSDTVIHTRRPETWAGLSDSDAALLDFLRRAGRTSELSPEETIRRTIKLLSEKGRFERLLRIAASEPSRVRAMIGAIAQQLGKNRGALHRLRNSLNPFSRFEFGLLAGLRYAATGRQGNGADMKLFEHPDFEQAILRATEHFDNRGLRAAIIEKDYYVTEALRLGISRFNRNYCGTRIFARR